MSTQSESKADLIVHGDAPYNAEPPLHRLRAAYRTGAADFYVRSHGDLPEIDANSYRLAVRGDVTTPLDLSLDDLRTRFPELKVTAVMQCAGNRRFDMQAVAPVSGDPWAPGAIGNADWTGVRLADVLAAAGIDEAAERHVAFESHDTVHGSGHRYGVSITLAKALHPDTLLAYAMNGSPLPREHGYPLRAVVPGFAGVRSPKWLKAITVQDRPSDNPIQAQDYKLFPPDVTAETADPAKGHTIETMPLNAAICEPARGALLKAGPNTIRGYAIAGDRAVMRVDVSGDGGRNWRQADLSHEPDAPFAWTFWEIALELPPGEHELAVRAWDEAGQTQPSAPDDTWNYKGYLSAAWHRVRVTVASSQLGNTPQHPALSPHAPAGEIMRRRHPHRRAIGTVATLAALPFVAAGAWMAWSHAGLTRRHRLPSALYGRRRVIDTKAGRVSFYGADEAEGRPLLLIHSINAAANAYEVRPLYEHYRKHRPVYALDLPGFGFSERADRIYTPRLMTDAIKAVVAAIARRHGMTPIDAIALSLSCEYLARAALERPDDLSSLGMISPTGFDERLSGDGPDDGHRGNRFARDIASFPLWSRPLFDALVSRPSMRYFLEKTWGGKDIDEGLLEYDQLSAHQPGAEHAPFSFLSGYLFPSDISRVYEALRLPVWVLQGRRGDFVDYRLVSDVAGRSNWTVHRLSTGAFPHFEDRAAVVQLYDGFLARVR